MALDFKQLNKIDRALLLICCLAFIVIPFATITELHALSLVVIAGVCISWWLYLSYTDGAATFGLPPTDRITAIEHVFWMLITSAFGTLFIIGGVLLIVLSNAWIDVIIPICLILATLRIMISCIILGKDGVNFIRNDK